MVIAMAVKVNNAAKTINKAFYGLWISKCNHILAKGGRSSTKSSVISTKLVEKKMQHPMSNVVCLRQFANTLYKSVYSQIKWAIIEAGLFNEFIFTKNPLQIIHKEWETGFYFSGADDPEKLKSLKIPFGFVSDVWFEEMDSFSGEEAIDKIEDTFIRNDLPDGLEVTIWGSWNPPRNPYSWINEYVDKHRGDDDYYIHHSTYLDDLIGYNSDQIKRKIEKYKENDFDYYRWMYLGEVIGMGNNIYNMNLFNVINELPDNDRLIALYFAIDTGHQVSATSCCAFATTARGNVILVDTYYYSPAGRVDKKAPSELSKELHDFMESIREKYNLRVMEKTIDSAEGGIRNQYYLDYSERLHPVAKKSKVIMIDYVHDLLAQGRFFILSQTNNQKKPNDYSGANDIFLEEHKKYRWDEKTVKGANVEVVKEDDHTCDTFQYFVLDNLRELGLDY
nr:PBSX family phage terminase large subunit [Carnobacterium maltaromaticum]